MFTSTTDEAISRWTDDDGTEWAVAPDHSPQCPAGDWYDGHNCARRTGDRDWIGDTTILDEDHEIVQTTYNGETFEAAATTREIAEFIVHPFAHWAEGDVYVIGRQTDAGTDYLGEVYTADGLPPDLAEVKNIWG